MRGVMLVFFLLQIGCLVSLTKCLFNKLAQGVQLSVSLLAIIEFLKMI